MSDRINYGDYYEAYQDCMAQVEHLKVLLESCQAALAGKKGLGPAIDNFVAEAEPMLTELYEAMKKAKGSLCYRGLNDMYVKARKKAVVEAYRKDMLYFLPEWLQEDSLYIFKRNKQYAVDFKGRLLQKAVEHHLGIEWDLRDLGKRARKYKQLRVTK